MIKNTLRIVRGGTWYYHFDTHSPYANFRNGYFPDIRLYNPGFRCVYHDPETESLGWSCKI